MPYAEIGASFNNSCFGLLLWGGCFVCCFEFGCIRNIVYLARRILEVELATFPGKISGTVSGGNQTCDLHFHHR